MDIYTPRLIAAGLRAMIGKGSRSPEVKEAILRLNVENFPAIVANDIYGGDLFELGKAKYQREK